MFISIIVGAKKHYCKCSEPERKEHIWIYARGHYLTSYKEGVGESKWVKRIYKEAIQLDHGIQAGWVGRGGHEKVMEKKEQLSRRTRAREDDIIMVDGVHLLMTTQSGQGHLSERLKGHGGKEGMDSECWLDHQHGRWSPQNDDQSGEVEKQWVHGREHQQARDRTKAGGQQLGGLSKGQLWLNQNRQM